MANLAVAVSPVAVVDVSVGVAPALPGSPRPPASSSMGCILFHGGARSNPFPTQPPRFRTVEHQPHPDYDGGRRDPSLTPADRNGCKRALGISQPPPASSPRLAYTKPARSE